MTRLRGILTVEVKYRPKCDAGQGIEVDSQRQSA